MQNNFSKIFIIGFIVFIYCSPFAVCFENSTIVKVNIIENAKEILLYIPKKSAAYFPYTHESVIRYENKLKTNIVPVEHGIKVNGKTYKVFGLRFKPLYGDKVFINNIPYKGEVLVLRTETNKLSVINYINISDYLKGVLVNEISHNWPEAVIKAQAVAARTYTIYRCMHAKYDEYDLKSDVTAQVYKGSLSERIKTNLAIDNTIGQVLMYNDRLIPAFYHACCGGYTANAEDVWGIKLPVFKGVEDGFCKKSPHFKWDFTLSFSDLEKIMVENGTDIGKISRIFLLNYNKDGRVNNILLIGEKDSLLITARKFRKVIGLEKIRSTKFILKKMNKNKYRFDGYGWGHGVGMCQWGAYYMARRGYNYKQILKFYYPGVEITEDRKQKTENR